MSAFRGYARHSRDGSNRLRMLVLFRLIVKGLCPIGAEARKGERSGAERRGNRRGELHVEDLSSVVVGHKR